MMDLMSLEDVFFVFCDFFLNRLDTILGGLILKKEEVRILAVSEFVSVKEYH